MQLLKLERSLMRTVRSMVAGVEAAAPMIRLARIQRLSTRCRHKDNRCSNINSSSRLIRNIISNSLANKPSTTDTSDFSVFGHVVGNEIFTRQ